ncbi:MAG: DJ-1/PfpI family protein [Clostridia bacterium]|nr:DJ-1/PfpI family protein [Clostridia bacterium]
MVYILLTDGFEEVEALTPIDLLRRSNVEIKTVGIGTLHPTGAHGVQVVADITEAEVSVSDMEMLILPGGYPGYANLDNSKAVHALIDAALQKDCFVAAICGAPTILGKRGDLNGKVACCYPGMEADLKEAIVSEDPVCVDGHIITSRSAGTAMAFALTLVDVLCGKEQASKMKQAIVLEK